MPLVDKLILIMITKTLIHQGDIYFVYSYRLICGLTHYTTKSHIARACLEAVCFQTREVSTLFAV